MKEAKLKALRRVRIDAGLTISELAQRAGVSRDTISNAERGHHSLQAPTLSKIARALGKTPSELLAEEERLAPKAPGRSSLELTFNDVLEEERREAEGRYLRMSPEEFDELRAAANAGEIDGGKFHEAVLHAYNAAETEYRRLRQMDALEEDLEEARELYREAHKRWWVVVFDRAEATIALDKRRDPEVVERADARPLPLDAAYEEVRGRLGVTA